MKKLQLKQIIREMIQQMDGCPEGMYFCKKDQICKPMSHKMDKHHSNKHEGKMAKYDALELADDAMHVHEMIQEDTNLPEWVESKITIAADYMNKVKDYLTHHMKL